MKHLSLFLCIRYLTSKRIVLLSITAVAISAALLIVVASLFNGFIDTFESAAAEQTGDIVIAAPIGYRISDYDPLIGMLRDSDLVIAATPVLVGQGLLLIDKGNVRAVSVWGIDLATRQKVTPVGELLIRQKDAAMPEFSPLGEPGQLGGFVGIGVIASPDEKTDEYDMEEVKATIGRRVALTTGTATREPPSPGEEPEPAAGQQSFKRRTVKFTVTDVVYSGMYDLDRDFIYLPIADMSARIYPGEKTQADTIQIKLAEGADPEVAMAVVSGIWRDFAQDRFAWSGYATISTSVEMQARLIGEYRKQLGMLMLIFGVLSGGVVLLISCIFYLIVITKQKDIAIVKSCGLGSGAVAGLFVAFGVIVGLAGSVLGSALGYLITKNINPIERFVSGMMGIKLWKSSTYMFSRIPNQIDTGVVFWVIIAAVSAAAIGALIPAIAAARLKPVEILRYE